MKKSDLKKLAMLGLTGGILVASQAAAHVTTLENQNFGTYLVGGGCGGGCGAQSGPRPQNGDQIKKPEAVQQPSQGNVPEERAKIFSRTNKFNRLVADNDEKALEKKDDKSIKEEDSNKRIAISGTNNGQKYPTLNHGEGELAESRIVSQLSKENLDKYRKMSFEGKQLVRKIANENSDPNKAVQLAEKQLQEKNAKVSK